MLRTQAARRKYSASNAAQKIATAARRIGSSGKSLAKLMNRQLQLSRQDDVQRVTEVFLVFVEAVVHLPKAPVDAREFRDLGGGFCVRMNLGQWEVPENKSQAFAEMILDALDYGIGEPAEIGRASCRE